MNINVAIPLDQFEYLSAKASSLKLTVPGLIKNLLAYGRLTPISSDSCFSDSSFLPKGVKRLPLPRRAKRQPTNRRTNP